MFGLKREDCIILTLDRDEVSMFRNTSYRFLVELLAGNIKIAYCSSISVTSKGRISRLGNIRTVSVHKIQFSFIFSL